MFPILFTVGGFPFHSYGVLGAVSFLVGAGLVLWRSVRAGLDKNDVADVIFWMAMTGLLGARLVFVLQNPGVVTSFGQLFDLRGGGLVFYGALLVGIPVGFQVMRSKGLPPFRVWDILGTAFPLAHAISRVGCFAAGCCYGTPTDVPWAVTFPVDHPFTPGGIPLHPVQLYEVATLLAIAAATNAFYRYRRFDGQVFLLYLVLYAVGRAVLEVFRGDVDRGWFLPELLGPVVTWSQGVSVLFGALALIGFVVGARRQAEKRAIGATITGPTDG